MARFFNSHPSQTGSRNRLIYSPRTTQTNNALLLALAVLLLVTACSPAPATLDPKRSKGVAVVPYKVEYQSNASTIEAVGTARAKRTAVIFAETGGEVIEMPFAAGAQVEESDIVVQLEAREERLAVRRAEIAVKDAEQLLDRYQRIDVPGAISDSQIDEARTALDAAQIELQIAENALAERSVRAPFSGYLGLSSVDPGTRITPSTAITQLDDRSTVFIEFDAPEQVFGRIELNDLVSVTPFANLARSYQAQVLALGGSINPVTRAFRVRASITNEDDDLRPGMSFKVAFTIQGPRYPAVPEAAIVWGSDGAYLWGIEEGLAKRIPLTIVARADGLVLVKAALTEGMMIVARGVQKAREGRPITFNASPQPSMRGAR